jgi:hypothetical protein
MKLEDIMIEEYYEECEECLVDEHGNIYDLDKNIIEEATAERQFKRYGTKFVRQFRCMSGPKQGKMVKKATDCGKRKDPLRVRLGKKAARMKKGERVRKSNRTKRKTLSQLLTRRNKVLRGDV